MLHRYHPHSRVFSLLEEGKHERKLASLYRGSLPSLPFTRDERIYDCLFKSHEPYNKYQLPNCKVNVRDTLNTTHPRRVVEDKKLLFTEFRVYINTLLILFPAARTSIINILRLPRERDEASRCRLGRGNAKRENANAEFLILLFFILTFRSFCAFIYIYIYLYIRFCKNSPANH